MESDVEFLSDGSSSSQDDKKNKKKKKQRKISLYTWDGVERQSVEQFPVGIDGLTEIKGFVPDKIELLQDGRKWKKTCLTVWRGHDLRIVKVLLSAPRNTVHLRCSLG